MRTLALCCALVALASCKKETPAGTVVTDWSYEGWSDADAAVVRLSPPKTVEQDVEWPAADAPPVQLHVETEIGDKLVAGTHWHTPRHVRITLVNATTAKMPVVECMPAPSGDKLDQPTPIGRVGCFFSAKEPGNVVFEIDGEGHVTRETPAKP